MPYYQNYNPLGNVFLSTVFAALPIVVLLYLLAIHPWTDKFGHKHRGIFAPYAAISAAVVGILVSVLMMRMPVPTAISAFVMGVFNGLLPIGWIVFSAIFLYTMTVVTGKFEIVKNTVAGITPDRRLQALLVAFSFGAFMEGAAGFGTPVAVAGAMMVGLGFRPLQAAVICLIANTAPVAWGAIGTPIIMLGKVSGIPEHLITMMAGRQLPFFSIIVPFWLVATLVFMDKGKWKDVWEVWPATLVCGASFALTQFLMSQAGNVMLVDIMSGIVSMIVTALFLKVWQPKHIVASEDEFSNPGAAAASAVAVKKMQGPKYTTGEIIQAWLPWVLLAAAVFLWGMGWWKSFLNGISAPQIPMPYLHGVVFRMPPVVHGTKPELESAIYVFNWLSAAGTGIMIAALISGFFVLRLTPAQWSEAFRRTVTRMKVPITVITTVVGLGFTTRYAGTDAILGLAFTRTGAAYPFFASMLGWLGVFLTGSDTSSNAMFGSLQRITAEQLGLNPVLIVTANSTGGVMGKMIDAQSIVVATVACYENHEEGMQAVGPIFRNVVWHSLALAILLSALVWLQAYVFTGMQVPFTP
ncbi:L-lactate permease [Moorella sp. Hama-1]|uniref:L-lactate permease n=1 Tax=Moorella sp. Hama-1 TaxID=2138101 RepID=UPI000D658551|nr:lactate permease LctP family transporter [Moorella sp. Hama-1]BCV22829.1 L-lactate permease [Moorella sp. Hama-1]